MIPLKRYRLHKHTDLRNVSKLRTFFNRSVRLAIARQFASWMIRWWEHNWICFAFRSPAESSCRRDLCSNIRWVDEWMNCRLLYFTLSRTTEGFFFVRRNQRYWNARVELFSSFGKCDSAGFLDWYDSHVCVRGSSTSGAHDHKITNLFIFI